MRYSRPNTALVCRLDGLEAVVKILLRREEVNPNNPRNDGRTPLRWATSYCHRRIAALLHSTEAITARSPKSTKTETN